MAVRAAPAVGKGGGFSAARAMVGVGVRTLGGQPPELQSSEPRRTTAGAAGVLPVRGKARKHGTERSSLRFLAHRLGVCVARTQTRGTGAVAGAHFVPRQHGGGCGSSQRGWRGPRRSKQPACARACLVFAACPLAVRHAGALCMAWACTSSGAALTRLRARRGRLLLCTRAWQRATRRPKLAPVPQ